MARFTKIPETNLAGTLGSIVGKSAGTVISSVNLAANRLQTKLDELCKRALSEDSQTVSQDLEKIEKTVDTLEKSINTAESTVQSLDKTATAVAVPVAAAKVALNVVKYLPLPQMWLVTSVSALQADLIQMLSELIAQIEQIVLTLTIIVKLILDLLKKLKDLLSRFRKVIAALKAALAFQVNSISDHDRKILKELGILTNDGGNIFETLASSINGRLTSIIWIGDYTGIDTGSLVVENRVKAAESGTKVDVPIGAVGNWITVIYCFSSEKPEKPVSRDLIPEGWSSKAVSVKGKTWYSKGVVSGLTGKVLQWTEPKLALSSNPYQSQIQPVLKEVNVFKLSAGRFRATNFNMEEANAVVLSGPDEAYWIMMELLRDLDEAPLTSNLKSNLCLEINPQEDQSEPGSTEEWYISKTTGEKYLMTLKSSSTSPKIATQRYVEVTDENGGVVFEGPLTFATNSTVIFDDTRVRLIQFLG